MKKILLLLNLVVIFSTMQAQRIDVPNKFYATTEKEVYALFKQILDSTIYAKKNCYETMYQHYSIDPFHEMETKDTILVFEQDCNWYGRDSNTYICNRISYTSKISNCMPLDFYEHFLDYLHELSKSDNYYAKECAYAPLYPIQDILIKQYESGKLSKNDSLKAWDLIQLTTVRIINEEHSFYVIPGYHDFLKKEEKYMTDNIRQALIREIDNPYYPATYLDSYMSQQDTACIDTTGIPNEIKIRNESYNKRRVDEEEYYAQLGRFDHYRRKGEYWGGFSAGQAYLKEKRDKFLKKGYLDINIIAEYAHKKHDELLIKHLKEFKKKHPDYPLKYF